MDTVQVIGLLCLGGLVLFSLILAISRERAVQDPDQKAFLRIDDLANVTVLDVVGRYRLEIFRQSGSLYKEPVEFDFPEECVAEIIATFRRAKIDSVRVVENTRTTLSVTRLHYCHKGSSEGRKVGHAEISLIPGQSDESRLRLLLAKEFSLEEMSMIEVKTEFGKTSFSTGSKDIAERLAKLTSQPIQQFTS